MMMEPKIRKKSQLLRVDIKYKLPCRPILQSAGA